jgi:nicotinamide riboside kinase
MNTNHKATIITGREGSGKTQLARAIAAAIGPHIETNARHLNHGLLQDAIRISAISACIVDEFDPHEVSIEAIKAMATRDTVPIFNLYRPVTEAPNPHFIFVTQQDVPEDLFFDRRFRVIRIY